MKKDKIVKHIKSLIVNEVAYFNGWAVPIETMEKDCQVAAENVYRYLRRGRHLTSAIHSDDEGRCNCINGFPQSTGGCPVHGIKF